MPESHNKIITDSIQLARQKFTPAHLGERMFVRFFERHPEARAIYADTDIPSFAPKKFRLVEELITDSINHHDYAVYNMFSEIFRHRYYGVKDKEYYYALIDAYADTIEEAVGSEWSEEIASCWRDVRQTAKAALQQSFNEAASC